MRPEYNNILTGVQPLDYQAVTIDAVTTNCIKVGTNAGAGEPLKFRMTVKTSFHETDAGTNGTVTFVLQHCATSGGGYADLVSSAAIGTATLVAGYELDLVLPNVHDAYIAGYFNVSETYDQGEVIWALYKDVDTNRTH